MATLSVFVSGYGVLRDSHYPDNVVFYVTVQQGGHNSWTVYRRYESFQRLSSQLLMMFAGIPPCPPRSFDARNPESVERGRVELSMWIIQLLHHHPIYTSHVFIDFVSAEANIPPPGLQPANSVVGHSANTRNNIGELDMDEMFDSAADDDAHGHDELHEDDNGVPHQHQQYHHMHHTNL
uniref:PX domain-containing protein n=1 Tax=Globisporangium ultimum (strain ATCC 200006 / CBS 805.95 / DAOM BR144) TaxID=431595 RepID=K3WXL7_GLOUD